MPRHSRRSRRSRRFLPLLATAFGAALGAVATAQLLVRYRAEVDVAYAGAQERRLHDARLAWTARGPIEYSWRGSGPAVLALNGAGGGYAQGLLLEHLFVADPVTLIAVSRPGYHGTPLTSGATFAEQADLFAALLDEIDIQDVLVVAVSAGGLSALQFALRHPERCRGLVLVSGVGPTVRTRATGPAWTIVKGLIAALCASDGPFWVLTRLGRRLFELTNGVRVPAGDPRGQLILDGILGDLFPSGLWATGTLNDIAQAETLADWPLERLTVPTLLFHGTADTSVPYAIARETADRIPGAKLIGIPGGSHFIVATHRAELAAALARFTAALAPA